MECSYGHASVQMVEKKRADWPSSLTITYMCPTCECEKEYIYDKISESAHIKTVKEGVFQKREKDKEKRETEEKEQKEKNRWKEEASKQRSYREEQRIKEEEQQIQCAKNHPPIYMVIISRTNYDGGFGYDNGVWYQCPECFVKKLKCREGIYGENAGKEYEIKRGKELRKRIENQRKDEEEIQKKEGIKQEEYRRMEAIRQEAKAKENKEKAIENIKKRINKSYKSLIFYLICILLLLALEIHLLANTESASFLYWISLLSSIIFALYFMNELNLLFHPDDYKNKIVESDSIIAKEIEQQKQIFNFFLIIILLIFALHLVVNIASYFEQRRTMLVISNIYWGILSFVLIHAKISRYSILDYF